MSMEAGDEGHMLQKIIVICGPTGVGKTRVGIELAKKFGGEIVSADSQQVYKGLDIGTAKPSPEERSAVPHHLIDVVSPDQPFDVGQYVKLADDAINAIVKKGHVPFIVGGTGLYIKALCHGLVELPPRDDSYRTELIRLKEKYGANYLHKMLHDVDPEMAKILSPNDTTRLIRSLEVMYITGCSIRHFQKGHGFGKLRYNALKIGLMIDRAELYKHIDARVDKMLANGLLEETRLLVERYGSNCQALKAVGYKEIVQGLPDVVEEIKRNTRHYAKRQLTWFRRDKEIHWFDPADLQGIEIIISRNLSQNLTFGRSQ